MGICSNKHREKHDDTTDVNEVVMGEMTFDSKRDGGLLKQAKPKLRGRRTLLAGNYLMGGKTASSKKQTRIRYGKQEILLNEAEA